jgi:DNA-binding IclR family transcriptional regulator
MTICMEQEMKRTTDEALVLDLLAREGSATIEELMDLSRMSWEQVFGLIDRLSRSGSVRLTRVGNDYYVENNGNGMNKVSGVSGR